MNLTLSAEVLCEVSRVSCSSRIFNAPWGRTPVASEKAFVDGRRIGHETVKRNKGGNGRKYREQPIENDPSRDGQQAIFVHLLIHPPENTAPVGPKEKPGRTDAKSNRRSGQVIRSNRISLRPVAPLQGSRLVHHSDRGSQYVSIRYTERLAEAGVEPSVGSVGDFYDNALAECQSASNFDPRSASKIDPILEPGAAGSARPGGAGLGCAAGASAVRLS